MRPIDADALVAYLDKMAVTYNRMADEAPEEFKSIIYGKFTTFVELTLHVNRNVPTLDCASKWISVKDRLPPDQGKGVLVVNGHGCIRLYAFWKKEGDKWTWVNQAGRFVHVNDITHWMPLPEPPKEG